MRSKIVHPHPILVDAWDHNPCADTLTRAAFSAGNHDVEQQHILTKYLASYQARFKVHLHRFLEARALLISLCMVVCS